MADSLNKFQAIGRLGKDPEIRSLNNGTEVVSFTMAVSERWKDRTTSEWKEVTEWLAVTSFVPGIVALAKNLVKGSRVYIEGALQTRKFKDRDGNERQVTEIALKQFGGTLIPLDPRGNNDSQERQAQAQTTQRAAQKQVDDFDDELPF